MAKIKPFMAYRPESERAADIAALPYDVYSREEACKVVEKNPDSFLAIDRAETQFSADVDIYDERVYAKAHEMLWNWIQEGRFVHEEKACYYIYEQVMNGRSQKGIVACASIDDYLSGVIKKHENTRADKEEDRIRHVDACCAQTGPIFLAYRKDDSLQKLVYGIVSQKPIYDFTSEDGITHRVWIVSDDSDIVAIAASFERMNAIYIADGHHRCASAVKVGLKRRENNPAHNGTEEYNYFLSVLFSADELYIMDYNRVIKDLNGYTSEKFLERIALDFEVEFMGKEKYKPSQKGEFGMYLENGWYKLKVKEHVLSDDVVDGLDVSILQNALLKPVLNIQNPKTDKRINFIGGIRGLEELERRVHSDMKVAFAMYPTSIYELFAVADAGRLMPPKSTWFEPKLRSGLFIHEI